MTADFYYHRSANNSHSEHDQKNCMNLSILYVSLHSFFVILDSSMLNCVIGGPTAAKLSLQNAAYRVQRKKLWLQSMVGNLRRLARGLQLWKERREKNGEVDVKSVVSELGMPLKEGCSG